MRARRLPEILLAAVLLSVLPAAAQADEAAVGDALFEAKCRRCHGVADLAEQYFAPGGAGGEAFARKLKAHGGTDEAGDRDIAAFLAMFAEGEGGSVDQAPASQ